MLHSPTLVLLFVLYHKEYKQVFEGILCIFFNHNGYFHILLRLNLFLLEESTMLLPSLAIKIIDEVRKLTSEQLIITNKDGTIIASTLPERIGKFHEGALLACSNKETIRITKEDENHLKGVKAGICLPICFHQEVIGVIGITGEPKQVESYGELLKKMTELLIQESYFYDQREWMQRAYETFLFDWLNEREWTDDFYERANVLHIDLQKRKQVIMGGYNKSQSLKDHHLLADLQNLFQSEGTLILQWGLGKIIIIVNVELPVDDQKLKGWLGQIVKYCKEYYHIHLRFGVGNVVPSEKLKESFSLAERALKAATSNHNIVFENELGLEMCLQEITFKTKKQFVHRTIGKILHEHELLETLRTLMAKNNSLKETAEALHIHINTLHYRLKKVEEITSLRPRYIKDLTTLYLAIKFLDEYPIDFKENA
jgi:carbohydrate diacid regulator